MIKRLFAICFFLVCSHTLFAAVITEQDIRQSVSQHHPKIKMELEKINSAKGKVTSKYGQLLDTTFQASSTTRTEGYYSGNAIDARVSKPFQWMNSAVYGGYRKSDGSFPVYEEDMMTNEDGEMMAGVKLSLLADGKSTEKLMGYYNAVLDEELAKLNLEVETISLMRKALKLYWTWVITGYVTQSYLDLYTISEERNKGILTKFKRGDVPQTYVMENEQYILQRRSDYLTVKQKFEILGRELSLYFRDNDGNSIDLSGITYTDLPSLDHLEGDISQFAPEKIESHPILTSFDLVQKQIENDLKVVKNQKYPAIDIAYEISDDMGSGSKTRSEVESKLKAKVQVPIERRDVFGREKDLRSKQNKLIQEKQWMYQQLRTQLENSITAIKATQEIVKNQKQAQAISTTLFYAEENRFKKGDSDFFNLNMSQQNLIKAMLDYYYSCLEFKSKVVEATWVI